MYSIVVKSLVSGKLVERIDGIDTWAEASRLLYVMLDRYACADAYDVCCERCD